MASEKSKEAAEKATVEFAPPPSYEQAIHPHDGSSTGTPLVHWTPTPGVVYQYVNPVEVPYQEAPDHMLMAILATIFCCMPLGVAAIFKAAECKAQRARGNREMAVANSKAARRYSLWSIGLGFVIFIFVAIIYGVQMSNFIRRMREREQQRDDFRF